MMQALLKWSCFCGEIQELKVERIPTSQGCCPAGMTGVT